MLSEILQKFVKWLDPRLEKYRGKKPAAPKYAPKTLEELVEVLQRTPADVLSGTDRARIAAVMSFDSRVVGDLMVGKDKMVFVKASEVLGPLVLDKLYQSGFTNFPVVDSHEKVVGILHTEALNALEIRKTEKAEKYMDANVCYLHVQDKLSFAVEEIERTGSSYFLVMDAEEKLVGFFTVKMLLDYLLG